MTGVVVVGEALVDVVHRADGSVRAAPGGSAANVAVALGRRGVDVALVTCLGEDDDGRSVLDWLQASHVDAVVHRVDRTATARARLDAEGSAEYTFEVAWNPGPLAVGAADIVHVGSIGALLAPGADRVASVVRTARPHALITYDPNVRPALLGDAARHLDRVEMLVSHADVVKASDEDLRWLYPEERAIDVAERWQRRGPAIVIVTRGGDGADAVTAGGVHRVAGSPVVVSDTVGAGDTFMAAFLTEMVERGFRADAREELAAVSAPVIEAMLAESARAAAVTVSRPGADPPWAAELADPTGRPTTGQSEPTPERRQEATAPDAVCR